MQAYSQLGPIKGTIAAVLIGTLGAIQLGTVMNTPLPEVPSFAEGGFGKDGFRRIYWEGIWKTRRNRRKKGTISMVT